MRNSLMSCISIYIVIRISDIFELKVRDVKGNEKIKDRMILRENKTTKERKIAINKALRWNTKNYGIE